MASNELEIQSFNGVILRPKYPVSRRQTRETLTIRDAQIRFRNFAGKERPFNDEGSRNFAVELDEALAADLEKRGWSVKPLKNYDDDGADQMWQLPVTVSFKVRPPRIYMVTGGGQLPLRKTMLPEDMLYMMDQLELAACHMVVSGSNWEMGGRKGKKAYLQSFFGHVLPDELEQEYESVEDVIADDTNTNKVNDDKIIDGESFYND